jgi:hypothetical protein
MCETKRKNHQPDREEKIPFSHSQFRFGGRKKPSFFSVEFSPFFVDRALESFFYALPIENQLILTSI